jgi:hypothetical protein
MKFRVDLSKCRALQNQFFVVSVQVADNAIGRWADTKTGQTVRAQPTERGSEGRVSRR